MTWVPLPADLKIGEHVDPYGAVTLKRVYQRIGLRNRAEAAAFVHRQRSRRAPGFADGPSYTGAAGRLPPVDLRDELGLTAEILADRRQLLGLSDEAGERLVPFADAVDKGAETFVAHLIDRWLACEHTAYLLYDDSLLLLAVNDVAVDGERLERVGVTPTIEVPFPLEYAAGKDPQLDKAVDVLTRQVGG